VPRKSVEKMQEEYLKQLALASRRKREQGAKKFKVIFYVLLFIWLLSFAFGKIMSTEVGNKVAVIPIEGAIMSVPSDVPFSSDVVDSRTIVEFIKSASEAKNVKAVILEINSPGGTVVASKEIADAVSELEKPVVALIREIGTSGAYWVASASDFIIADEMSLTGSIGVNGGYLEFAGLMKKYGVGYQEMKAGLHKDLGNPYEHLSSEEREILQDKLDLIHENFIQAVADNRNMSFVEVADVAEGLFYLGVEAKDLGLIDAFGSFDEAKEKAEELVDMELEEKRYEVEKGMFSIFDMLSVKGSYNVGKGIGDSLTEVDVGKSLIPMV
tara:strand:- start:41 stop:1021 length:981 start_codon:yes stop_codon:yes gene_type:complete